MFQYVSDVITYNLLQLESGSKLADVVNFFFYDVLKILVLIIVVVTLIAYMRTFVSDGKVERYMSKAKYGVGNIVAALFGALTPFCSCSSIPIFIGFLKARIPVHIAFTFIITSPLVNEVAFVIMGGLFGWKIAVIYALSGILLGIFGGLILGVIGVEKYIILDGCKCGCKGSCGEVMPRVIKNKFNYAVNEGVKIFKSLFVYVLFGVGIGALIHGYVPEEFFTEYIGRYDLLSVPIAVLLGMPIYAGCSTVAPIIFSITQNGVPLGTSLAFMMSIAGLSLPEAIMLKRVMKFKLLGMFFGIVMIGIILIGYLFNSIL